MDTVGYGRNLGGGGGESRERREERPLGGRRETENDGALSLFLANAFEYQIPTHSPRVSRQGAVVSITVLRIEKAVGTSSEGSDVSGLPRSLVSSLLLKMLLEGLLLLQMLQVCSLGLLAISIELLPLLDLKDQSLSV